jgi:hypothetical protein
MTPLPLPAKLVASASLEITARITIDLGHSQVLVEPNVEWRVA